MATYERLPGFYAGWEALTLAQQERMFVAVARFVADLRSGGGFRHGLRVKGVHGHFGVFEMTWAPDGRATFSYGEPVGAGEVHIVWRRCGTHDVLDRPWILFSLLASPLTLKRMRLWMEVEGMQGAVELPGDGSDLVAFMSFAVMRGFGAQHPLIALADRLHEAHHVRLGPLTTFYEAAPEDAEDREKLELAWQDARPLSESLESLTSALAADAQSATLLRRAGAEGLPAQAEALLSPLAEAAESGRRVRLVYEL